MKLVAYETGQTLFRILMDEVRPVPGLYLPDLMREIGDRYALLTRPANPVEAANTGVKFQTGRLLAQGKLVEIKQLDIYNDGLLIATRSTEETEAVFEDISSWLITTCGFRNPISAIARKYVSSVIVDFEKPVEPLLGVFSAITEDFARQLKSENNVDAAPGLFRLAISADPTGLPPYTQTQFLLERRNDSTFAMNRYIASAPLASQTLLSFLKRIEERL